MKVMYEPLEEVFPNKQRRKHGPDTASHFKREQSECQTLKKKKITSIETEDSKHFC